MGASPSFRARQAASTRRRTRKAAGVSPRWRRKRARRWSPFTPRAPGSARSASGRERCSSSHPAAARAEQAVLKELADLCDGPITDEELEDCRRGLLAGMNGLEDTLGGIETWYYMEVLRGGPVQTPDDARRALLAVTREDVRDILKQFTLSVSCLLTREEGNENG